MTIALSSPIDQQPFCYRPLDVSKPSLRLVEISHIDDGGVLTCKIRHAEITEEYIALSYMWGPEIPCHDIVLIEHHTGCNGRFKIRASLYSFLFRAASTEAGKPFWTDAICIDQQNIQERNHQVGQMGSIYRNASEVRVWLGDDTAIGDILSAMTTISYKGDLRVIDLFDEQLCPVEFRSTFRPEKRKALLRNEYWSRTWIVQEIMLAAKITVQGADGRTPWSNLAGLYAPRHDEQSPFMQRLLGHWRAGDNLEFSEIPRQYPINFLLDSFGGTRCADSRDHLYGLLALTVDGHKLNVDYTETAAQLLVRATKTLKLDAGDLQPLLPALNLDAKTLHSESGICVTDLWKTQRALSQISDILDTKWIFPPCSVTAAEQCKWSETGNGEPCDLCCATCGRICDMPECLHDWQVEVDRLIVKEKQGKADFAKEHKSLFKEWLCHTWPAFLASPHPLDGDHYKQCFACDVRKSIQDRRKEWANMKHSLQNSPTGHRLPSMDGWLAEKSQPSLGLRRAGRPLTLGPPPAEGQKLAAQATAVWAELFKGTARVEGWE